MEPIELQAWAMKNKPPKEMHWERAFWDQVIFVRDSLKYLMARSNEAYRDLETKVISTHMSKSISCPVCYIELPNGLSLTMRYNFHDWKISVNSPFEIDVNFMDLFDLNNEIPDYYCEGFPSEMVYGPYASNNKQFTIELNDREKVYVFFWTLFYFLKNR